MEWNGKARALVLELEMKWADAAAARLQPQSKTTTREIDRASGTFDDSFAIKGERYGEHFHAQITGLA